MPSNIKTRKVLKFLGWLKNNKGVEIIDGKEHLNVKCIHNGCKFPLPCSHKEVKWVLIREFKKWLVKNEICTVEEIRRKL